MKTKHKIWKTIKLPAKTSAQYLKEIEAKGMYVSDWAKDIAEKVPKGNEQEVALVKITLRDWFDDSYPNTQEIYERAKKESLEFCPPQVGLQLRLEYTDQPKYEWPMIGMKPITDRGGRPYVFYLYRDEDELELNAGNAGPARRWDADNQFVFLLRKSDSLTPSPSDSSLILSSEPLTLRHLCPHCGEEIKIEIK